ncbi:prepilin peptidase [Terrihabitans sp. B22-R8]|uniref:prepilin peptidase n=1 Tax=Terrihabitans sp. B22-R8 TaxID=3425128 RepID=UPI00403D34E8
MSAQSRPVVPGIRAILPTIRGPIAICGLAVAAMAGSLALAPGLPGLLAAALVPVVMAIAVVDARRFIIPDELTIAAVLLGLAYAAATGWTMTEGLALAVLRGGCLALAFLAIRIGYRAWRGREGLGFGDVKLAFAAGIWLDWMVMPIAIDIATGAALLVYVLRQRSAGRRLRRRGRLPFGLFLAPAIWIGWCLQTGWLAS